MYGSSALIIIAIIIAVLGLIIKGTEAAHLSYDN